MKLKLKSKRLTSGRCQIKFSVSDRYKEQVYGYLLAESGTTLKEVVSQIEREMINRQRGDLFYHSRLYNMGQRNNHDERNIVIFNS